MTIFDNKKSKKDKKINLTKKTINDSRPQLKDGCVNANHVCRGKSKVCPTCSMVYCEKHFNREIHVDYCKYRVNEDRELLKKYGNS